MLTGQMVWTDGSTLIVFFCHSAIPIAVAIEDVDPRVVSVLLVAIKEVDCS